VPGDIDDTIPDESLIFTIREPDEIAHDNIAGTGDEINSGIITDSSVQSDADTTANDAVSSGRIFRIILIVTGAVILTAGTAFIVVRKIKLRKLVKPAE
jgi:hypothetical protein